MNTKRALLSAALLMMSLPLLAQRPPPGNKIISTEGGDFILNAPAKVWYGDFTPTGEAKFATKDLPAATHLCNNSVFGDPYVGRYPKGCSVVDPAAGIPQMPNTPTPVPSVPTTPAPNAAALPACWFGMPAARDSDITFGVVENDAFRLVTTAEAAMSPTNKVAWIASWNCVKPDGTPDAPSAIWWGFADEGPLTDALALLKAGDVTKLKEAWSRPSTCKSEVQLATAACARYKPLNAYVKTMTEKPVVAQKVYTVKANPAATDNTRPVYAWSMVSGKPTVGKEITGVRVKAGDVCDIYVVQIQTATGFMASVKGLKNARSTVGATITQAAVALCEEVPAK